LKKSEYIEKNITALQCDGALDGTKIIVFGIGYTGGLIKTFLEQRGISVWGYIDNDAQRVQAYNEVKIPADCAKFYFEDDKDHKVAACSPEEAGKQCTGKRIVLILSKYKAEIEEQLLHIGFNAEEICEIGSFAEYQECVTDEESIQNKLLYRERLFEILSRMQIHHFACKNWNEKGELLVTDGTVSFWIDILYPTVAYEIFCEEIYKEARQRTEGDEYIILDMGANHGYSALWFAENFSKSQIWSYELMPENSKIIKKNLEENDQLTDRIHVCEYGLGKEDKVVSAYYFDNRDAISSFSEEFLQSYASTDKNYAHKVEVPIRKASDITKEFLKKSEKVIIKIDVEGAEYDIFGDIAKNNAEFLDKVEIIIGEAHMGIAPLKDILDPFGYELVVGDNSQVCPFLFVKKSK